MAQTWIALADHVERAGGKTLGIPSPQSDEPHRGPGATEPAARGDVRHVAESLRAHEDFNGEAFLIVPG
jgi:hypothetical protein